jgi:DNA-directed RNA polymerase subunit K/omega
VGPLVPSTPEEKSLSIALREINAGQLTLTRATED